MGGKFRTKKDVVYCCCREIRVVWSSGNAGAQNRVYIGCYGV